MIRKLLIYMFFLTSLSGCVQGIAFLGPVFSYSQSGNVVQSALSYGSNQALKKIKERSENSNKKNSFNANKTVSDDNTFLLTKKK